MDESQTPETGTEAPGTGAEAEVIVGRRRGQDWVRVTRGLHRRTDVADPRLATLRAWQLLLPEEAAFAALTSAEQWGWDLPPMPVAYPVCVAMPHGVTAPTRPGQLRVTRHRLPPPHVVRRGVRMCSPAETILTCAPLLSLLDLVVLVDSALRARDVELVELWLTCRQRRRGVPKLRRALALVDAGAGSVMETLLRVLHAVCGHDVVTQHVVLDAEGEFTARGDLWLRGTTTLQEYDGAVHAERHQFRKDRRRDRRLSGAGWVRNGYTDEDLLRRPVTILREADAAIGRSHEPTRIRSWLDLFRESSFTPAGRAALTERLGGGPGEATA